MDTLEAKVLMEDSVCCLARMMEQIRLREIEKAADLHDEPLQDHLAECTSAIAPFEGMDFNNCLEYLKNLHEGFKVASDHEDKVERLVVLDDYDATHICDMVMGFIGHGFPQDLMSCASEIKRMARDLLRSKKSHTRSDKGCQKLLEEFVPKAEEIITKHGYKLWNDGQYSLPLGYLQSWMELRYWNKD